MCSIGNQLCAGAGAPRRDALSTGDADPSRRRAVPRPATSLCECSRGRRDALRVAAGGPGMCAVIAEAGDSPYRILHTRAPYR